MAAEGGGDYWKTLYDALEAPQVYLLHPGATDNSVTQRRQHYLFAGESKRQMVRGQHQGWGRGSGSDGA